MMARKQKKVRWTIATARQKLPALIKSAAREPQAVYRRNQLVAAVVGADLAGELEKGRAQRGRPALGEALAELRRICGEEAYQLPAGRRRDRSSSLPGRRRR